VPETFSAKQILPPSGLDLAVQAEQGEQQILPPSGLDLAVQAEQGEQVRV